MDNKRTKIAFEFEVTDLPMIADAFAVARNTALMCGNKRAQERMEAYREMVEALVPPAARVFDSEVWAEIGIALKDASVWDVRIDRPSWQRPWDRNGHIAVVIDGRIWRSERTDHGPSGEALAAVTELIEEIAPVSAERRAVETAEEG